MPPPAIDEAEARALAGRLPDRTGAGIPGRFGIRTQRSSGPQRSVSDPGKQNASATCIFRLCCRKTREKREGERRSPSGRRIHPEAYRTPGRQNQNAVGGRAERPRVRLGLAEPGSEEGSCDRFLGCADRSFPTETQDEPGISAKPDYILCYTSRSRRCFRLILPDGWKPFGMEPAGKCLHLAHSVY